MKGQIDYRYSYHFYERLLRVRIDGIPLADYFVTEGVDYLQFYTQRIFEDIKSFSREQRHVEMKGSRIGKIKDSIIRVVLISSTFIFIFRKRPILVYAIDMVDDEYRSDFRLKTLYRVLTEKGISFGEIFHVQIGKGAVKNLLKRKRLSLYLEAAESLYGVAVLFGIHKPIARMFSEVDCASFEESEKDFALFLLKKYVRQIDISRFKISFFSWFMKRLGVQSFFTIDDARYCYELFYAARTTGIKSYAIQHGHFTKYHVGWLLHGETKGTITSPDHFLVWSNYWKNELLRLKTFVPASCIEVAGEKDGVRAVVPQQGYNETITVLIPYETACPKDEIRGYIMRMLEADIEVIFKLRPDMSPVAQLTEYGLEGIHSPNFVTVTDIEECISRVDIVAGVYSTFLYDMIAYAKCIVLLETVSDYGEGMYVNGLAELMKRDDDVRTRLSDIKRTPEHTLIERMKKVEGTIGGLHASLTHILEQTQHE